MNFNLFGKHLTMCAQAKNLPAEGCHGFKSADAEIFMVHFSSFHNRLIM